MTQSPLTLDFNQPIARPEAAKPPNLRVDINQPIKGLEVTQSPLTLDFNQPIARLEAAKPPNLRVDINQPIKGLEPLTYSLRMSCSTN